MNSTEFVETAAAASVSLFTFIDYSVFGALLIVSLAIGLYFGFFSKQEQTTEEYLQGGHKMQALPIAMSLVARYVRSFQLIQLISTNWRKIISCSKIPVNCRRCR